MAARITREFLDRMRDDPDFLEATPGDASEAVAIIDLAISALSHPAALEAECARKDEALRQIAEPRNWEEQDRARSIARAALGPWTPTHQLPGGAMVRQRAVNAYDGGRAIDLFEARDGTLYSRYPDDQRVRPLTPAEQAAYVEAAMGERT